MKKTWKKDRLSLHSIFFCPCTIYLRTVSNLTLKMMDWWRKLSSLSSPESPHTCFLAGYAFKTTACFHYACSTGSYPERPWVGYKNQFCFPGCSLFFLGGGGIVEGGPDKMVHVSITVLQSSGEGLCSPSWRGPSSRLAFPRTVLHCRPGLYKEILYLRWWLSILIK